MELKLKYNPDEKYYFTDVCYPNVINIEKAYGKTRKEDGWEVCIYHFTGASKISSASNPIFIWRGKYFADAKQFVQAILEVDKNCYAHFNF